MLDLEESRSDLDEISPNLVWMLNISPKTLKVSVRVGFHEFWNEKPTRWGQVRQFGTHVQLSGSLDQVAAGRTQASWLCWASWQVSWITLVILSEIEKIYIVLRFYELEFDGVSYQAKPKFTELEYGGPQISLGTRAILAFRELRYCVLH